MTITFLAMSGYDRKKNPVALRYRRMTAEEAAKLNRGTRVPFLCIDGRVRECTINGKPKTWKTRPGYVHVPCKYGMYEYFTACFQPTVVTDLLVLVEETALTPGRKGFHGFTPKGETP